MSAPRPLISAVILCVVLAQVVLEGFAEEARQRSQLQLINGSNHSVAVFWLKTGTERVASLINLMLANRPDVRRAMIESGSRLCIIGWNEFTTDQPEFVRLARHPLREFAHNIHLRGLVNVDPTFDERLKKTYDTAMMAGLWKGKYASVNHHLARLQRGQQAAEDLGGVGEVVEEFVRGVGVEFSGGVDAGGDGGGFGADGAGAADVGGGVADDPDGVAGDVFLQGRLHVRQRCSSDVVAFGMMIAVGPAGKEVGDVEVPQLDPGTFSVVAGEQAEVDSGIAAELFKQGPNAWQQTSGKFAETVRESIKVGASEALAFAVREGDAAAGKDFVFDAAVGSSGRVHCLEGFRDAKFFAKSQFHGFLAGTAGVQHGAVNVKEQNKIAHGLRSSRA